MTVDAPVGRTVGIGACGALSNDVWSTRVPRAHEDRGLEDACGAGYVHEGRRDHARVMPLYRMVV